VYEIFEKRSNKIFLAAHFAKQNTNSAAAEKSEAEATRTDKNFSPPNPLPFYPPDWTARTFCEWTAGPNKGKKE